MISLTTLLSPSFRQSRNFSCHYLLIFVYQWAATKIFFSMRFKKQALIEQLQSIIRQVKSWAIHKFCDLCQITANKLQVLEKAILQRPLIVLISLKNLNTTRSQPASFGSDRWTSRHCHVSILKKSTVSAGRTIR